MLYHMPENLRKSLHSAADPIVCLGEQHRFQAAFVQSMLDIIHRLPVKHKQCLGRQNIFQAFMSALSSHFSKQGHLN